MRTWMIIGFIATAIIAVALPVYAMKEANRMTRAQTDLLTASVAKGQEIYAQNCVICHGADGQGISAYPGLDNQGVREMEYDAIYKTIERGRYNTAMAAWGVKEGGVLNAMQIDQVIAMLQNGNWAETAQTVKRLGLNPPTMISAEISPGVLAQLANLPHGQVITAAVPVYAAKCAGCHGAAGEGTAIAPALNNPTLRNQKTDEDVQRIITTGVPGTLMAGWNQALAGPQITDLVGLIRYWDEIPAGALPQTAPAPIASTDATVIAAGGKLYNVTCATCHGANGQGTRMAPALNVQSVLTQTNDQALKAIISQGVPNTRMPAWGGRLTDEQLNSLVSFIRAWEPNAPAVAQPGKGQGGQGGGILRWLWGK